MSSVLKSNQPETLLTSMRADPSNVMVQNFLGEIDQVEKDHEHLLKWDAPEASQEQRTALMEVIADARAILNSVR
jgi:hypothetical protein